DDIDIPVEECPCCCSNDEGLTWFSCDEFSNPLDGDPANCAVLNEPEWFWSTEYNMICRYNPDDASELICSQEKTDEYLASPATPTAPEWEPPVAVDPDDEWWATITELPNTGT